MRITHVFSPWLFLGIALYLFGCTSDEKPHQAPQTSGVPITPTSSTGKRSAYTLITESSQASKPDSSQNLQKRVDSSHNKRMMRAPSYRGGNGGIDPFGGGNGGAHQAGVTGMQEKMSQNSGTQVSTKMPWKMDTTFVLFTVDTMMQRDEPYDVFLSIYDDTSKSTEAAGYQDTRDHAAKSPTAYVHEVVNRDPDYRVTLHGNDFRILSVTDSIQHLYPKSISTWKWEVTPLARQARELTVVVSGIDSNRKKDRFFVRTVTVHSTPIQYIGELAGSQYGFAAYTALLGLLVWYVQNNRKKSKDTASNAGSK